MCFSFFMLLEILLFASIFFSGAILFKVKFMVLFFTRSEYSSHSTKKLQDSLYLFYIVTYFRIAIYEMYKKKVARMDVIYLIFL